MTYTDLATKARRRAKVGRIFARIFIALAGIYAIGFLVAGLVFGEWMILLLPSGALLAISGISLIETARTEQNTAARNDRLTGVWPR